MTETKQVGWYAATPTGRERLNAKSDEEAIAIIDKDRTWMGKNTYAIYRIEKTVVQERVNGKAV